MFVPVGAGTLVSPFPASGASAAALERICLPPPPSLIVCGLSALLSAIVALAMSVPTPFGLNVTVIVHDAPAAMLVPQLFVCVKLLAFVPEMEMFVKLSADPAVFVTVATFGLPACPSRTLPMLSALGTSLTVPLDIVIEAPADFVESDTEVAVNVAVGEAGTVAGAVTVVDAPLAVVVGASVPQPGEHTA